MGFSGIVNQIASEARWRKQNMLFSATLEGAGVRHFANDLLNEPAIIEADPPRREKAKIHQWYHLPITLNISLPYWKKSLRNKSPAPWCSLKPVSACNGCVKTSSDWASTYVTCRVKCPRTNVMPPWPALNQAN